MKKLFFIIFLLISISTFGQLNGYVKIKILKTEMPYSDWFESEYKSYELNKGVVSELKPLLRNIKIEVFFGAWCSDSQNQLPDFVKILEEVNYKIKKVRFIAMDRQKTTNKNYEKEKNITNVPTFIFYKKNKEIGRIIESPNSILEVDIFNILN